LVHMLGRHGLHDLPLQVMTRLAGSDGGQIPRRTRVQRERLLQRLTLDGVRVRRQYVLEDAALERQEHRAEQVWIELREFLECWVDARRARYRGLSGLSCARCFGGLA